MLRAVARFILVLLLATPVVTSSATVDTDSLAELEPLGDGGAPHRGDRLLLIQFWASWCHSCGTLMWDLDELAGRRAGVDYLVVSLDDSRAKAVAYLDRLSLFAEHPDRYYLDTGQRLAGLLDVVSVPTVLLVAADGRVVLRKTGHLNGPDLAEIDAALETGN